MGFFSSVSNAVSNVAKKVAAPVQKAASATVATATKAGQATRDFVASPTGSALLPMAAIMSPTGRANLANYASMALPIAGNIVAPGAGGAAGEMAGTLLTSTFGQEQPIPPMYGSEMPNQQDAYAYQWGGGGGGGYATSPSYATGGGGGVPGWVWAVVAGAAVLLFTLILRRR